VVVVGYGNDLRGDDGIGPRVAAQVEALGWPGVRALVVTQLTPELAEVLAGARLVVFVDACVGPAREPVEVGRGGPPERRAGGSLTHTGSPGALLALARELYGRAPETWWVTVAGEGFGLGEGLSESAERHCRAAVERIEALLRGELES
jgi:hydrogenase maturation protease